MASNPVERECAPAASTWFDEAAVDELVRRAQGGDSGAFDALVRAVGPAVFNLAYRMVGNREDAGDLAQEALVKLCRSLDRFAWKSRFSTWLYAVAANTCRTMMDALQPAHNRWPGASRSGCLANSFHVVAVIIP